MFKKMYDDNNRSASLLQSICIVGEKELKNIPVDSYYSSVPVSTLYHYTSIANKT
jgi:hypothetical protein